MTKGSWFHGKVSDSIASAYYKKASVSACHNVEDYVPKDIAAAIRHLAHQNNTHENAILASLLSTTASCVAGKVVVKFRPDTREKNEFVPSINILTVGSSQKNLDETLKKFGTEILEKVEKATDEKILCNVNTISALQKHLVATKGRLTLIKDNIFVQHRAFAAPSSNISPFDLLNRGYIGKPLDLQTDWRRPTEKVPSSCFVQHGTSFPKPFANLLRDTPTEVMQHLERWLVTVIPSQPTQDSQVTAPLFDLDTTFTTLYTLYKNQAAKEDFVLSRQALKQLFVFEQQCRRQADAAKGKSPEEAFGLKRQADLAYKLALVLHVMVHSLLSYKSKNGQIRIPGKVPHQTIKQAIRYVEVSENAFQIFMGREPRTVATGVTKVPKPVVVHVKTELVVERRRSVAPKKSVLAAAKSIRGLKRRSRARGSPSRPAKRAAPRPDHRSRVR